MKLFENTKSGTLKAKVNNLDNDATVIHVNQYNTDQQKLEKKIGNVDKKYQIQVV